MKINFLTSLFIILCSVFIIRHSSGQSPDWQWAKAFSGTSYEDCRSIAIDRGNGDVYTTGSFNGTVDFDPGAGVFNLTATATGLFISKLDSSGNFVWAKAIVGTLGNAESFSIAIDTAGSGDVYTTGALGGTVDFDPGSGVFNLTTTGSTDIFISKLNSSGDFVWAKLIDVVSGSASTGYSIAIDPAGSGDVYTTGQFNGTADFDPGAGVFNLTEVGSGDIFISKLDSSGKFVWAKAIGGTGADNGYSITIDPSGNGTLYTTGVIVGIVDFDPGVGVFNLGAIGSEYIFISKLDSSGNFVWAKAMGSGTGLSIAIDPAGNGDVYTTGFFVGTVDFDPGAGVFNLTSAGNDIFICKLNSLGNFVWAKAMSGISYEYANSIAIDPGGTGDVYTAGHFDGTVDFDPGTAVLDLTATGSTDIFISKLDSSGNFVWVKTLGGIYWDMPWDIALGTSGTVHVAGYFNSPTISFGSTTLTNAGGNTSEIFIARLDTTIVTGINDVSASLNMTRIFPNPFNITTTISFFLTQSQNVSLKIFDVNGRLVETLADKNFEAKENKIVWDVVEINAGIYFLQFKSAEIIKTEKLIITK